MGKPPDSRLEGERESEARRGLLEDKDGLEARRSRLEVEHEAKARRSLLESDVGLEVCHHLLEDDNG